MKKLLALWRSMNVDDDALADYRAGIVTNLSLLGAAALAALAVLHLAGGRLLLMLLNLAVAGLLLGSAWALSGGRRAWVPFPVLISLLIAANGASIHWQGVPGVLWAFPTLFLCYFVLPRRLALVLSLVLLVVVGFVSLAPLGMGLSLRVVLSMAFVLLMINVVLGVMGDLQRALVTQAITDPLTGTYNRRHLQTHLDRLSPAAGHATAPGPALLAIDIDHFKRINDQHGHAAGDQVLCQLVQVVSSRQRLGDVLFRTGGEEFMLLLPRTRSADAQRLAEELRARVASSPLLPDGPVTVSIGVSALAAGQGVSAWLKSADAALYRAKQDGRNRVAVAA
ncbi:MAG: GGDEF domain-containing protein [Rubrivivax sp.]|nr:GGDEF domain-containing protein [Rubrivivax sp.]